LEVGESMDLEEVDGLILRKLKRIYGVLVIKQGLTVI